MMGPPSMATMGVEAGVLIGRSCSALVQGSHPSTWPAISLNGYWLLVSHFLPFGGYLF